MYRFVLTLTLIIAGCAAETRDVLVVDDEPLGPPDAGALVTDRDPAPLYEQAAGSMAPIIAGSGGAGGRAPELAGSGGAEPQHAGAGGAAPPMQAGVGGSAGAPVQAGAGGSAGAAVEAGAPAPAPVQPERFCKISAGQRYAGQVLGCTDAYSRSAFGFLLLRWQVPSAEAGSGYASVGCSDYATHPCVTGEQCTANDTRENGVEQIGVCL